MMLFFHGSVISVLHICTLIDEDMGVTYEELGMYERLRDIFRYGCVGRSLCAENIHGPLFGDAQFAQARKDHSAL